jgi:hypothetical protein
MAMHEAGIRLQTPEQRAAVRSDALAALPTGTVVAVFENRGDASHAAVQLLTNNPDTTLWLRTGKQAGAAIREARAERSLVVRLLRGFGDEELLVRDVLRQADDGRSVLVIQDSSASSMKALRDASHVYQLGLWTVRPLR